MEPRQDQWTVLHRLQSEGQITATEYAHLAAGLGVAEPPKPGPRKPEPGEAEMEAPDDPAQVEQASESVWLPAPRLRDDLTGSSITLVAVLGLGLLLAGAIGPLPWLLVVVAIAILASTLVDGWRMITNVGSVVLAGAMLVWVVSSLGSNPEPEPIVTATIAPVAAPDPKIPGSLGISMDQIGDAWNTLDGEPRITKGLTRYSEAGDYDTFVYRFGEWGRLAGAYDRGTDVVYALMASGWLTEPPTSQFYLRLCFMTAPYSQDCVDSYLEHGLGDVVVEELEEGHRSEWKMGENTWRLTIEDGLLTIRVFGADAA